MEPIIPLPDNLSLHHERDAVIIRRRWFTPSAFLFVFIAFFWNIFAILWLTSALMKGLPLMVIVGLIHAFIGLGLVYFCVASFLNKTDISVDADYLRLRHHPLPWFGTREFRSYEINQLFCKKHVTRSKKRGSNKRSISVVTYRVYLILNNGLKRNLISGLKNKSQAHFIEREIESVLGLENQAVAGELK